MKYYIRTTGERTLDKSYSQVNYELLIDNERNNIKSFINQIKQLVQSNESCVILEDDCVLCKDFDKKINEVISKYPNKIINFFTSPGGYLPRICECSIFMFMQCVYFPKDILKLLADNFDTYYKGFKQEQVDLLVAKILGSKGITFLSYRPCLVQHLSFDTLIHDRTYVYRTPYFIDFLEDLNISYEEAKSEEKTNKLREHLKKWVKEYEKNYRLHTTRWNN